jgi:hypothetical protein
MVDELDLGILKNHAEFWERTLKGLSFAPTITPERPAPVRRRRRKPSIARALRAAQKAGVPIARIELEDGTALVAGDPRSVAVVDDLDVELAAFKARHGQDRA